MPNSEAQTSRGVDRLGWRSGLDILATILMIAASGVLIWKVTQGSSSLPEPPGQDLASMQLPSQPIVVDATRVQGSTGAKVILIEYSDFQCPFCARFARDTWPTIRERYVSTGKLQVTFRHLPISAIHPSAFRAAEAVECAGAEGKFWQMHDLLFRTPARLETSDLLQNARSLTLDGARFEKCLQGEMTSRVNEDIRSTALLGVTGTPTFFLGVVLDDGTALLKRRLKGARTLEEFTAAIDEVLGGAMNDRRSSQQ